MSTLVIDIATFTPILILAGFLLYLSHKETKKSAEQSAAANALLESKLLENIDALRESELARMNELGKAAEFGRLAQGLFHDLMTPLTSVILHTEELKKKNGTAEHLKKATEAGERMTRYMQSIRRSLSEREEERACDLQEELSNILHLFSYQLKTSSISVEVKNGDPVRHFGSPTKFRQIFSNLISNSIDSFENVSDRRKKIELNIREENKMVSIAVKDNGCGMSPQIMEKVFDPFFTTKAIDKGTGIGLTTVKSIVEKNFKGTLEIKSKGGEGTQIYISFPGRQA